MCKTEVSVGSTNRKAKRKTKTPILYARDGDLETRVDVLKLEETVTNSKQFLVCLLV